MYPHRPTHRPILTLAAAALALALTGCGALASQGASTQAPSTQPSATSTAAASPAPSSATEAGQPTATAQAPASTAPAAALATFTFPGGRMSFDHPQDWTVEGFHSADAPVTTAMATVKDAVGRTMATVYVGAVADVVTSNVERTVYETVPVPGLASLPAPQAHLSWYREDASGYRLQLTSGPVAAGAATDADVLGLVRTHEGVLSAEAVWDAPFPFATEEAAKAWYASDEGRQIRALLLSLRAS